MNIIRASPLEDAPDRYDGIAALIAAAILGWAFLYAIQPILGVTAALAALSIYVVGRTADYVHVSVVVGSWIPVFIGLVGYGLQGVLTGSVFGVLIYGIWAQTDNN
jgi:hypothetical protein